MHQTAGYSHITFVDSGRVAVFAGQCPLGADAQLVGRGDVLAQVDQVVANDVKVLAAAGRSPADVIRSVIYVLSDDPGVLSSVWDRLISSEISEAFTTASALLGVAALGYRDQMAEVDLTAVLSSPRPGNVQ